MPRPAVKICGLQRAEDARLAVQLGASYLGVVLSDGFGRSVRPEHAVAVVADLQVARVAVLVDESPTRAARHAESIGAEVIQLHGHEPPEAVAEIKRLGPWRLWKALRARSAADVRAGVAAYAEWVDGFLIEGHREGVIGGGGATLTATPAEVRAAVPATHRFVLAGGLTPETVADAMARFAPDVVDVSSGVESAPGGKDPELLRRFFNAVREHAPEGTDPRP